MIVSEKESATGGGGGQDRSKTSGGGWVEMADAYTLARLQLNAGQYRWVRMVGGGLWVSYYVAATFGSAVTKGHARSLAYTSFTSRKSLKSFPSQITCFSMVTVSSANSQLCSVKCLFNELAKTWI